MIKFPNNPLINNSNFQTPPHICKYMVDLLPESVISVLEPTPGAGNLVFELKNRGFSVVEPLDFNNVSGRFESIVMNPPFTPMPLGYAVLYRCMELSDIIVALMPWLSLINSEKRTRLIEDFGLKSITHLQRSVFPGSRVQTCILHMEKGYDETTSWYNLRNRS